MADGKIAQFIEMCRTKWRRLSRLELRFCLCCDIPFPSAGPDERICPRCTRKHDDARARAVLEPEHRAAVDFFDDTFDVEQLDRAKRAFKHDSERRSKRQKKTEEPC